MIVEKVSPVVVHLAEIPSLSYAAESNVKVTFNEKSQPISDAHHALSVSTFQKTAVVTIDKTEKPNKFIKDNEPLSHKGKIK